MNDQTITVEATIDAPPSLVWEAWTQPEHVTKWNFASDDWHSPTAQSDLRAGGKFSIRMEAKDGSVGFDFDGEYTDVQPEQRIAYTIGDGREVVVEFESDGAGTHVVETFAAESEHPIELQRSGWQSILDNFKGYVESLQR